MNDQPRAIAKETFAFFSSLKLAVLLLLGFTVLLAWATVFESMRGTEEAQRVVYSAIWFDFLIFFLGVNVLCSALSRWPWRMKHIGFLTTHLGIIIILVGSMATRKMGVEGQVILQEGESTQMMMLYEPTFSLSAPRLGKQVHFQPRFMRASIPEGKAMRFRLGDTGIECYVEEYLSNPRHRESFSNNSPVENPAIRVAAQQCCETTSLGNQWMLAKDPSRASWDLGSASIRFLRASSEEELANLFEQSQPIVSDLSRPRGVIHLRNESDQTLITLDAAELANQELHFHIGGEAYHAALVDFFPRAGILNNDLVNKPDGPLNPALRLHLCGPEGDEEHLAFALYPEFGSVHGNRIAPSNLQAVFEFPLNESSNTASGNRIDVIQGPDDSLHYRAPGESGQWDTGTIIIGEPFLTHWNSMNVTVQEFLPRAMPIMDMYDAGKDAKPHNNPIARVRLVNGDHDAETFVPYNNPRTLMVGGEAVTVHFGQKQYPLGFTMQLLEFRAPRYPGTNRPALFESDVLYSDPQRGIQETTKIHMNHPLYYNNFAVYQSSYVEGQNGEPDISIFSVARAPGTSTIYLGSIVMLLGMVIMIMSTKRKKHRADNSSES